MWPLTNTINLKPMRPVRLLLLALLPIVSCNSQQSEKVEYQPFEDKATGWTTKYPASWERMSQEEMDKLEGRGLEAMEETLGDRIALTHTNLLWLKKDEFNSFTSNSDPCRNLRESKYTIRCEVWISADRWAGVRNNRNYDLFA